MCFNFNENNKFNLKNLNDYLNNYNNENDNDNIIYRNITIFNIIKNNKLDKLDSELIYNIKNKKNIFLNIKKLLSNDINNNLFDNLYFKKKYLSNASFFLNECIIYVDKNNN